jgi:hypothetical protein
MADTDWNAFTDVSYPLNTDVMVLARGAGGVNANAGQFLHVNASNVWDLGGRQLLGGSDAATAVLASGTAFNTGGAAIVVRGISAGFNDGGIEFYVGTGATGLENMRITGDGRVLVGQIVDWTGGYAKLAASSGIGNVRVISAHKNNGAGGGSAFLGRVDDVGGRLADWFYGSGSNVGSISTNGSSTSYNTSSDYRLKENFRPLENAMAKLRAMQPGTFEWIASGETTDGYLAHVFGEAVPGGATGQKDGMREESYPSDDILGADGEPMMKTRMVPDIQGIDQSKAVPALNQAAIEHDDRILALEAQVAELQRIVATLT